MQMSKEELQDCITRCWECRTVCQHTLFEHCLKLGGKHAEADHVRLMVDCMQACQTAADFMTRGSPLHTAMCAACADVCERCADSCEAIGGEHMMRCADACRKCAASCREMGDMQDAA